MQGGGVGDLQVAFVGDGVDADVGGAAVAVPAGEVQAPGGEDVDLMVFGLFGVGEGGDDETGCWGSVEEPAQLVGGGGVGGAGAAGAAVEGAVGGVGSQAEVQPGSGPKALQQRKVGAGVPAGVVGGGQAGPAGLFDEVGEAGRGGADNEEGRLAVRGGGFVQAPQDAAGLLGVG